MNADKPLILFDGVCNLCNKSVQFVIKRDPEAQFQFASLQSNAGQQFLKENNLPENNFNSFVLYERGKVFTRSTAALKVASKLKGWRWSKSLFIIPKFLRDAVYNLIANNRYKWFGKRNECMIPTPELKERFLS